MVAAQRDDLQAGSPIMVPIAPRTVGWVAGLTIAVLALLNVPAVLVAADGATIDIEHPFSRWFLLDAEQNLPTAYACLQLVACAVVAGAHALVSRATTGRDTWRWVVISLGFGYLAADEGLLFHERLLGVAAALVELPDWLPYDWVLFAIPVLIAVVAAFLPWLRRLPPRTRNGLLLGGAVYLGGAVGLETLSGLVAVSAGTGGAPFALATGLEEVAEMAGAAIALVVLLRHLLDRLAGRPLVLTAVQGSSAAGG